MPNERARNKGEAESNKKKKSEQQKKQQQLQFFLCEITSEPPRQVEAKQSYYYSRQV